MLRFFPSFFGGGGELSENRFILLSGKTELPVKKLERLFLRFFFRKPLGFK